MGRKPSKTQVDLDNRNLMPIWLGSANQSLALAAMLTRAIKDCAPTDHRSALAATLTRAIKDCAPADHRSALDSPVARDFIFIVVESAKLAEKDLFNNERRKIVMNTKTIARVLAGLVALACLLIGARYMFAPAGILEGAGFPADLGIGGLSTLRAVIGGAFITFAIVLGIHTVRDGDDEMIRLMVLFWILYTVGRVVGMVSDGIGETTIRSTIPGVVLLLLSIGSVVMFARSKSAEA